MIGVRVSSASHKQHSISVPRGSCHQCKQGCLDDIHTGVTIMCTIAIMAGAACCGHGNAILCKMDGRVMVSWHKLCHATCVGMCRGAPALFALQQLVETHRQQQHEHSSADSCGGAGSC